MRVPNPGLHPRVLGAVAVGGAVGGLARWGVGSALPAPWATALVNVVGCALIGCLAAWSRQRAARRPTVRDRRPTVRDGRLTGLLHPLLGAGLLGAFTTFATWTTDVLALAGDGRTAESVAHAIGLPTLAVLAAAVGATVTRRVLAARERDGATVSRRVPEGRERDGAAGRRTP